MVFEPKPPTIPRALFKSAGELCTTVSIISRIQLELPAGVIRASYCIQPWYRTASLAEKDSGVLAATWEMRLAKIQILNR